MPLEQVVSAFAQENIDRLNTAYQWKIPLGFPLGALEPSDFKATDCKNLKRALNHAWLNGDDAHKANLERWYVVVFGGVRGNNPETLSNYSTSSCDELIQLGANGIASWSKMLCVRDPLEYPIFDARVSISLNCLLHSNDLLGQGMLPILASQNRRIKRANELLQNIQPRPYYLNNFYTEYCSTLRRVAFQMSTPTRLVSVMDLEMLLFALAEELIENRLNFNV